MDKKSSGTISNVPNSNRSCFRNIYRSMLDTLDQGIATNTDVTNLYDDFNFTNDKFTDEEPEWRERIDIDLVEFKDAEFCKKWVRRSNRQRWLSPMPSSKYFMTTKSTKPILQMKPKKKSISRTWLRKLLRRPMPPERFKQTWGKICLRINPLSNI